MKKITLLFLLFFTQIIFAQFTANDVKYYVGTGTETAYLVVDFKDGTDDSSYAWGYRFNSNENPDLEDIISAVVNAEPNFSYTFTAYSFGNLLTGVAFNSHGQSSNTQDWWSTWTGTSLSTFSSNLGLGSPVLNNEWYGLSFVVGQNAPVAPVNPIAAYSSQWYENSDVITWVGTGTNQSLVVVDFGTDTNNVADSYVVGIQYDGAITAEDALDLIKTELTGFDYVMTANVLSSVTIGTRTETAAGTNLWKAYSGTDLSNWTTESDLSLVTLDNNDWLGLSIGTRRPFTPQDITAALSTSKHNSIEANVYPNPTSDILNIQTAESITNVTAYNIAGQKVLQANTQTINVSNLKTGVYVLKVETTKGTATLKFVKK